MERGACRTLWLWAVVMTMIDSLSDLKMCRAKIRQPGRLQGPPSGPCWLLHGLGVGCGGREGAAVAVYCCDLPKIEKENL